MADLAELQTYLTQLKASRTAILTAGQENRTGEFQIARGSLKDIMAEIRVVEMQIARIQGNTTTYPVFGGSE